MLFHAVAKPGTGVDIEQISIRIDEPLDLDRFRSAWQAIFDRHAILSARFSWEDGLEPTIRFDHADQPDFSVLDWTDADFGTEEQRIAETMLADRLTDFDLAGGPVHRFTVARLADDRWWILWAFHHALLDGRSFPIVLNEVFALYDRGVEYELPETEPFSRYIDAISKQELESARQYWADKLASFESVSVVPSSTEASTGPDPDLPPVAFIETLLDEQRTDRLRELADRSGVSLNTCIQAAWYLTLLHYTQHPMVTFGTTRACRHAVENAADMVGLLINTVPMVLPVDREETVVQLLKRVRAAQTDLRSHETTPLPVIGSCAPGGKNELFESIVVFDDASLDARMKAAFPEYAKTRHFRYDGQTNFPLTLLAYGDASMLVRLEYSVERYDPAAARLLVDHYLNLLDGMAADPDAAAIGVPYLTASEHERYDGWNDTATPYDLETTLHELFERQVAVTPGAPALQFGDDELSYDEFNRRANQLAHHLRARGVTRNVTVGLFAERSFEMMVGIYGIIKAGGAYVPLDPEHPEDRLLFMAEDSGVDIILTQSHLAPLLPARGFELLILDDAKPAWASLPETNPEPIVEPDDMAYLLYTSGSTGRPKGVMIEHRAIVNRLVWMQETYGLTADDCVLQKTPYTFDVSVWELFWPLEVGARLVMAEPGGHRDAAYLAAAIERHAVTTLHFVPSMLQLFVEEPTISRCRSIKRIICSGEALPRSLQDRLFEVLTCELHNLYGPTEAAVDVTWWACDAASPLSTVPIGHPIANTEVHVLDPDLQRLPVGVAGELHIGGVQLARGYHNRQELTKEKFIPDRWSNRPGARLYRTGDLVRHLPDGAVEFLGRIDHQVKIRGQRIELGEIESVIADHLTIREVVVVASGANPANTQLVAYAVGDLDDLGDPNEAERTLRTHCEASLACHMVPNVWMFLPALPLNANGKVDRGALPEPSVGDADREIIDAASSVEADVLAVWHLVLGDEAVGVTETFFDVGGNSLLLIRLSQLLSERFERDVTVPQLLRRSTIRQQATMLSGAEDGTDEAVSAGAKAARARMTKRGGRRRARSSRG